MRSAYRILAIIIAVEVVIQAMMIVFAVAGLGHWVDEGGTLDKAAFESEDLSFTGVAGFMVHGLNGMMIIPLLGLALLVVSFFAKVPGGVKLASIVLGSIVVQVFAGILGHDAPYIGMIHGLNAFILAGSAGFASRQAKAAETGALATVAA
jgi:H+/Cl- antiporter ClcA